MSSMEFRLRNVPALVADAILTLFTSKQGQVLRAFERDRLPVAVFKAVVRRRNHVCIHV